MKSALYDEQQGYYRRNDINRWGRAGDYRTSAETSVLFGAVFARFFAQIYAELGSPERFTIVEVGGGAGDFAASVLETLKREFPALLNSASYILEELTWEKAAERLAAFEGRVEFKHLFDLDPIEQGIVFSNELLDAFPIHRVGMFGGQLVEFYVDVGEATDFKWMTGEISTPRLHAYLERFKIQLREGQVVEINLDLEDWFRQVAEKLKRGHIVTVDYGAERPEETLRAFKKHQFASNILDAPGTQDITASVDWTAVKEFGHELGFETVRFERQDRFLLEHGLLEELERRVSEATTEAERVSLRTGAREMILPGGMAQSFQVLIQKRRGI